MPHKAAEDRRIPKRFRAVRKLRTFFGLGWGRMHLDFCVFAEVLEIPGIKELVTCCVFRAA